MYINQNIGNILKELISEWDDLTQKEYNPLKNALELNDVNSRIATNFRNLYHKVDNTMAQIIKEKYKGFNNSVLIYTEINKLYLKLNEKILNMIDHTKNGMDTLELDINKLEQEHHEIEKDRKMHEHALKINELYESFVAYDRRLRHKDY